MVSLDSMTKNCEDAACLPARSKVLVSADVTTEIDCAPAKFVEIRRIVIPRGVKSFVRNFILCFSLFASEHRLHAFLHLLRRDILLMCGDPPEMAKRILELPGAIAVELIHNGLTLFGTGRHRLF